MKAEKMETSYMKQALLLIINQIIFYKIHPNLKNIYKIGKQTSFKTTSFPTANRQPFNVSRKNKCCTHKTIKEVKAIIIGSDGTNTLAKHGDTICSNVEFGEIGNLKNLKNMIKFKKN